VNAWRFSLTHRADEVVTDYVLDEKGPIRSQTLVWLGLDGV
jgi:hypothetical protein